MTPCFDFMPRSATSAHLRSWWPGMRGSSMQPPCVAAVAPTSPRKWRRRCLPIWPGRQVHWSVTQLSPALKASPEHEVCSYRRLQRAEQRRRKLNDMAAIASYDFQPPTNSAPEWDRLRPVIDQALDRLNERDREIVLLRYYQGLSYVEVGAPFRPQACGHFPNGGSLLGGPQSHRSVASANRPGEG